MHAPDIVRVKIHWPPHPHSMPTSLYLLDVCLLHSQRGNLKGKNGLLYTHPDIRFLTFIYIKIGRFFQNMFEKNQVARPLLEQSPS